MGALAPCGTWAAYLRGCRCELCMAGMRAYHRERYRRKRLAKGFAPRVVQGCGTYASFRRGCRCDPCRIAYEEAERRWRPRSTRPPRPRRRGRKDKNVGVAAPLLEISPALSASPDGRVAAALALAQLAARHAPKWMSVAELVGEAYLNPGALPREIARTLRRDLEPHGVHGLAERLEDRREPWNEGDRKETSSDPPGSEEK